MRSWGAHGVLQGVKPRCDGYIMNVICMRHGQSEYNILGLCNDDPARKVRLTEQGRRQAERAAGELREAPLERIFCSELPRTRETALSQPTGSTAGWATARPCWSTSGAFSVFSIGCARSLTQPCW